MEEWLYFLKVGCFIWTFIKVANVVWRMIMSVKTHLWSQFKSKRVNVTEKYGSWAVVTGSSDGIGKEYAKELAKQGVNIVLISRSLEKLKTVAAEIEKKYNVKTKIIVVDFDNDNEFIYEHIEAELKDIPVGILVNNVGLASPHPMYFSEMPYGLIASIIQVNIVAALRMTQMILPQMLKRQKGAIVNISSMSDVKPCFPLSLVYASTKCFLKSFTKTLQTECTNNGITLQLISPGTILTNMTNATPSNQEKIFMMSPERFARSAVKLLGLTDHSAGHWFQDMEYFVAEWIPQWLLMTIVEYVLVKHRGKFLEKIKLKGNSDPDSGKFLTDK